MLLLHEVYCVGLLKTSSGTCLNQSENTLGISNQSLETNQDQSWLAIISRKKYGGCTMRTLNLKSELVQRRKPYFPLC